MSPLWRVARGRAEVAAWAAVALAALVGLTLMNDTIRHASATYDEVAYLRVAARWWRTGEQASISRMGSPLTFWKLQQGPVLWLVDRSGHADWIEDPIAHQATLLTWVRLGSLWIWVVALWLTAFWARRLHGPWAMTFAAWLFVLSPNLLAHGSLITMEMPLVAASTAMLIAFWAFLQSGHRRDFQASAVLGGLAFSCKFTAVVFVPILALVWWVCLCQTGECRRLAALGRVVAGMLGFVAILLATDLALTGLATIPPSETRGPHPSLETRLPTRLRPVVGSLIETPWPQDWVAFAVQVRHQASGGPSYLLGERRMRGWWYYYLVALAVKMPLSVGLLLLLRLIVGRRLDPSRRGRMLLWVIGAFLVVACVGSRRNYGVRYLLPVAPLAIVWVAALAKRPGWSRRLAVIGILGQAAGGRVDPSV